MFLMLRVVFPGQHISRKPAMPETVFVSTAIPYVNAKPHVGFALEIVQADAIARYFRLIGYDTFFLTGTDENSLKNVRAAAELGISTQELCDQNSAAFQKLIPGLNSRIAILSEQVRKHGTAEEHKNFGRRAVQEIFTRSTTLACTVWDARIFILKRRLPTVSVQIMKRRWRRSRRKTISSGYQPIKISSSD